MATISRKTEGRSNDAGCVCMHMWAWVCTCVSGLGDVSLSDCPLYLDCFHSLMLLLVDMEIERKPFFFYFTF